MGSNATGVHREPWNKGKIDGQKSPLKVKDCRRRSKFELVNFRPASGASPAYAAITTRIFLGGHLTCRSPVQMRSCPRWRFGFRPCTR